jgi:hypothetical protein
MKWLSWFVFGLICFGFGIIFIYWIQGQLVYESIQNFILTGVSFGLFVTLAIKGVGMIQAWSSERKKEKKKAIADLIKHTEVLIPELRKWAEQPLTTSNELPFLLAQQHIISGYITLRNIIEGKDGIKSTDAQYNTTEKSTTRYIRDAFEKQIQEKLPKLESSTINHLVRDIRHFHEKQHSKGRTYTFDVVLDTSMTPNKYVLQSIRNDGLVMDRYLIGDKQDLLTPAKTANNLLKDSYLQETTRTQRTLGQQIHKLRIAFKQKIHSLIDEITYAVTDEGKILCGKCKKCKDAKGKWKINHGNKK